MIIQSRNQFVKQVATLLSKDKKLGGSYVIGISGKWGEGKSTFLQDLEKELVDTKVVWLSPWKYAKDDLSLMRQLLKSLAELVDTNLLRKWWLKKKLGRLYYSSEQSTLSPRNLSIAIFIILGGYIIYQNLYGLHLLVRSNKTLATLVLIPVIMSALNAITTRKKSSKSIDTLDQFDDLLKVILGYMPDAKIVIFVDDLDRLTAEKAILVLDSLRTFFDNERLSFVVAGDHTVLESHLGRQLKPTSNDPAQLEEGRRFLKKIFDLYWRLPIPTQSEVEGFVGELLDKNDVRGKALAEFLDDQQVEALKERLTTLFDNNFRQIIRFVDRAIFTFQVLESQINNSEIEEEKKEFMRDIKTHPLLLIRILLLEDLANPLFEAILNDSGILLELESRARSRPELKIEQFPGIALSDHQRSLAKSILASQPQFYGRNGLTVANIGPFIHLSNDPSFGDLRGLSTKDFADIVYSNNLERLQETIQESGLPKLSESISYIFNHGNAPSLEQFFESVSTLLKASEGLPNIAISMPTHELLFDALGTMDTTGLAKVEQQKRNEFVIALSDWLDDHASLSQQKVDALSALIEKISSQITPQDIQHYRAIASSYENHLLPHTLSRVLLRHFVARTKEDFSGTLNAWWDFLSSINSTAIELEIDSSFLDFFVQTSFTPSPDMRSKAANAVVKLTVTHSQKTVVKTFVLSCIPTTDYAWDMAVALNDHTNPPFIDQRQMQSMAISALDGLRSPDELKETIRALVGRIAMRDSVNSIWSIVTKNYPSYLAEIFHALSNESYPTHYAPDNLVTNRIINAVIANSRDNLPLLVTNLRSINKSNWLIQNLNSCNRTLIKNIKWGLADNMPDDLRAESSRILDEYGLTDTSKVAA